MRILMLGNSFTFYNNMPFMLSELTGGQVVHHTRGGARLAEQLNPETQMGEKTLAALENESWDYVVLQEMSNGPVTSPEAFQKSVAGLCEKIRQAGAVPVLYGTWAYKKGSEAMAKMDMDYDEMYEGMEEAYRTAAEENDALLADVGKVFYIKSQGEEVYAEDGCHPNITGSRYAAGTLAHVILKDWEAKNGK